MKEELINLETAKLAKEKGFNIRCAYWFGCDDPSGEIKPNQPMCTPYKITDLDGRIESQEETEIYARPTQHLLQKWLREKYNIEVEIYRIYIDKDGNKYGCHTRKWFTNTEAKASYNNYYKTYEEALEVGLQEGLKLINKK